MKWETSRNKWRRRAVKPFISEKIGSVCRVRRRECTPKTTAMWQWHKMYCVAHKALWSWINYDPVSILIIISSYRAHLTVRMWVGAAHHGTFVFKDLKEQYTKAWWEKMFILHRDCVLFTPSQKSTVVTEEDVWALKLIDLCKNTS